MADITTTQDTTKRKRNYSKNNFFLNIFFKQSKPLNNNILYNNKMLKDYFKLSFRSAKHRKIRSFLTMIGIFIGIAAVVGLISLSQGLKTAVSEQFSNLGSDKVIVQAAGGGFGPPGAAVTLPITLKDKEAVAKVSGVDIAVGRLIRTVKIEFNDEQKFNFAVTIPKDKEERDLVMQVNDYKLESGKFFDSNSKGEVVVGSDFAKDYFEVPLEIRDRITIQDKEFKISGILKKSGNPQKDSTMVISESDLRDLLDIRDIYDIVPAQIKEGEDLALVSQSIKKALRKSRDVEEGKENFIVETPEQVLETLNIILVIIQGVLVGIAGISLVVGGIGIMNTMYTAVVQRTKEIGIMKSLGAKDKDILILFIIESGFLGFFGGLIGVILGFSFAKLVELVAFQLFGSFLIKANFSPLLMIGSLTFAFVVGTISGILPAMQAAKLKPIDALKK